MEKYDNESHICFVLTMCVSEPKPIIVCTPEGWKPPFSEEVHDEKQSPQSRGNFSLSLGLTMIVCLEHNFMSRAGGNYAYGSRLNEVGGWQLKNGYEGCN